MGIKIAEITKGINKYIFYLYNIKTKKIIFLTSNNDSNKNNILNKIQLKKNYNDYILVRVKLSVVSKRLYNLEKKSPFKVLGGPIYGYISEYNITYSKENGKRKHLFLKKKKRKLKNKVFFPKRYLIKQLKNKNVKWIEKDLKKIALAYTRDKLNTGLLAINTIKNIKV